MGLGDSKLGFWDEEWNFRDSQLSVLATASKLAREVSNVVTESHVCPPRRAGLLATASNVVTGGMSRPPWRAGHLRGELLQPSFYVLCFASLSHVSVLNRPLV